MTAPDTAPRQALEQVVQQRNPALTPDIISASSAVGLLKLAGAPLSDLSELISACEDSGFQQGLDAATELRVETFAQIIAERLIRLESASAALRAQAEADRGLREAVAQLMSDPWSYHEKGARCIDCGRLDAEPHSDDCAVVKIRVFIAQDELRAALAQAGGESL